MKWIKRDGCKTVREVIKRNTRILNFNDCNHKIKDVDKVITVLKEAKKQNKSITIVGDYDVDGVCATGIMTQLLHYIGINHKVRLPKRISEGFGLSEKIVDDICKNSIPDILITVDNGITAIDAVQKAKEKGIYVIITDHHLPNKDENNNIIYPDADIIINPNAIPNSCEFTDYCGAGIALKIAEEIIKDETKLNICKSYAALATVADVVPLINENHQIVKEGLNIMNNKRDTLNPGLKELIKIAGLDKFNEVSIGYKLGPMINAPGRLLDDGAIESLKCIASLNSELAIKQATFINNMNEERKEKVKKAIELVEENLRGKEIPSILVIKQDNIEEGILGIIAGKLTEKYEKPCIMLTHVENDILKGSARSCNGIHLKELLDKINNKLNNEAFTKYGGHAEAAGLSLKKNMFNKVREMAIQLTPNIDNPNKNIIYYDLEIEANDIPSVTKEIESFAPYGNTNDEIIVRINNFEIKPNFKGDMYTLFNENRGIRIQNEYASAMSFDKADIYLNSNKPSRVDIIGTLRFNYYKQYVNNQIDIIDYKVLTIEEETKNELNNLILS